MQVAVFRRSTVDDQAAVTAGLPKNFVRIDGWADELEHPRLIIRKAIEAFGPGTVPGRKRESTALKIIGLLLAAGQRAQKMRDWSSDGSYDPLPDFLTLQRLAKDRFGVVGDARHPVSLLRGALKDTVRTLRERPV